MKRVPFLLAVFVPALAAASVPVEPARETLSAALARTKAETKAAELRVAVLKRREQAAASEAARLRLEQQRAAADIALTEARLAAANVALTAARAGMAIRKARLDHQRAPLADLLAGLVTMGRRPPFVALADTRSITQLVRVRALIDATMPVIAQRSAALQGELREGRQLASTVATARDVVEASRAALVDQQRRFATLEGQASARAAALRASTSGAEDQVMAGGEAVLDLGDEAAAAVAARALAREVARPPLAPPRPFAPDSRKMVSPLAYRLPTTSPVSEGLGTVSAAGIRSRGIRFATPRGTPIVAPAPGRILFANAFRQHDGIVVIDHGKGWTSVLINVVPDVDAGDRVTAGGPVGRALGDVQLELRERGQPRSAALIAGSSSMLSNRGRTR